MYPSGICTRRNQNRSVSLLKVLFLAFLEECISPPFLTTLLSSNQKTCSFWFSYCGSVTMERSLTCSPCMALSTEGITSELFNQKEGLPIFRVSSPWSSKEMENNADYKPNSYIYAQSARPSDAFQWIWKHPHVYERYSAKYLVSMSLPSSYSRASCSERKNQELGRNRKECTCAAHVELIEAIDSEIEETKQGRKEKQIHVSELIGGWVVNNAVQ